jgi:hypothetical protein
MQQQVNRCLLKLLQGIDFGQMNYRMQLEC